MAGMHSSFVGVPYPNPNSNDPDGLDPPGPRSLDYLIQDPHRWIIDFQGALSVATLTDGGIS